MNRIMIGVCAFCAVCVGVAFAADASDAMSPEDIVKWAESRKTHHRVSRVATARNEDGSRPAASYQETSGTAMTERQRRRHHHPFSLETAQGMYAAHTNGLHRLQRFNVDSAAFKSRWLKRHEGATEADFEAWKKMSRLEKQAWSQKWREDHATTTISDPTAQPTLNDIKLVD